MIKEKMFGNLKKFDDILMKKVRMLETDIPQELEERVLNEINQLSTSPDIPTKPAFPQPSRKTRLYFGVLVTAASLFLAVLLAVTLLFNPSPVPISIEQDVSIDFAEVEGQPANTYIFNEQDTDTTIVWFEKAPIGSVNANLKKNRNSI